MARAKTYRKARYVQTLYEYDGPKVVLLKTPGTTYIVAVAIINEAYDEPFFGAEVTSDQLDSLMDEEYGLRYLFLRPKYKQRFILDLADLDASPDVNLIPIEFSPQTIGYLPGRTFFSSDFTEDLKI